MADDMMWAASEAFAGITRHKGHICCQGIAGDLCHTLRSIYMHTTYFRTTGLELWAQQCRCHDRRPTLSLAI